MKEQLKALYEVQRLDVAISQASAQLEALDGALTMRQKHAATKKQSDATHQTLIDTEMQLKDKELTLKSIDAKRAATEKKLYSGGIMSAKEVSSLEKEMEHFKGQQNELDEQVLELYDTVESLRVKSKSAESLVADLEQKVREAIAKEAVERKRLEAELVRLEPEREAAVAKVTNRQLLSRYEAIRKKSGSTAIAMILEHKCAGCHVAVTSFTIRNIFEEKGIEYCENCGRILMLDME